MHCIPFLQSLMAVSGAWALITYHNYTHAQHSFPFLSWWRGLIQTKANYWNCMLHDNIALPWVISLQERSTSLATIQWSARTVPCQDFCYSPVHNVIFTSCPLCITQGRISWTLSQNTKLIVQLFVISCSFILHFFKLFF